MCSPCRRGLWTAAGQCCLRAAWLVHAQKTTAAKLQPHQYSKNLASSPPYFVRKVCRTFSHSCKSHLQQQQEARHASSLKPLHFDDSASVRLHAAAVSSCKTIEIMIIYEVSAGMQPSTFSHKAGLRDCCCAVAFKQTKAVQQCLTLPNPSRCPCSLLRSK